MRHGVRTTTNVQVSKTKLLGRQKLIFYNLAELIVNRQSSEKLLANQVFFSSLNSAKRRRSQAMHLSIAMSDLGIRVSLQSSFLLCCTGERRAPEKAKRLNRARPGPSRAQTWCQATKGLGLSEGTLEPSYRSLQPLRRFDTV